MLTKASADETTFPRIAVPQPCASAPRRHRLAKFGFVNPASTRYDPRHLGSFARWAGIGYFIEKGIVVEQLPLLLFRSARL